MDYMIFVFALAMGFLFALLAFNKNGEVFPPILGAFVCIIFWVLFNGVILSFEDQPKLAWDNVSMWFEISITSLAGAFVGYHNTYNKKKEDGAWRFYLPAILMIITIMIF